LNLSWSAIHRPGYRELFGRSRPGALGKRQSPLDFNREAYQHKMTDVIKVILTAFVCDPNEVILLGLLIGDHFVYLAWDEGYLIV
ncbi:MAG: hypothetical protein ACLFTI_11295, partial [Anaerolineales bacterium]